MCVYIWEVFVYVCMRIDRHMRFVCVYVGMYVCRGVCVYVGRWVGFRVSGLA